LENSYQNSFWGQSLAVVFLKKKVQIKIPSRIKISLKEWGLIYFLRFGYEPKINLSSFRKRKKAKVVDKGLNFD